MYKNKKSKNNKEFSKILLIQESVLIWIISIAFISLSFYCVFFGYLGELPWLTTMVAFPWGAYGISQAFYYKKAERENIRGGIKYESVVGRAARQAIEENEDDTAN